MRRPVAAAALLATLAGSACRDRADTPSAGEAANQSPAPVPAPATGGPMQGERGATPLEITAEVDGRTYRASGLGECQHTPDASIYEVPASLWAARYSGGGGSQLGHFNLTIWELRAGGAPQVTLALGIDEVVHQIATVEKGQRAGKGAGTVRRSGSGGTLTVEGVSGEGASLRVVVSCPSFTVPIAEGG